MRRGSVQTWEPLARRASNNMSQFGNSRQEFMTSDLGLNDIEYERKGGFFMTHKKTALVISAVVLIVIAAGFVGAYIGSIPKEKIYDTMALIDGDVGCDYVESSKFSLSNSIHPSRYHIELSPRIEADPITTLRGQVKIEFRYNGSKSLNKLVLNARGFELMRTKLIRVELEKPDDTKLRRRRNSDVEDVTREANGSVTIEENFSTISLTNVTGEVPIPTSAPKVSTDMTIQTTLHLENHSITYRNTSDDSLDKFTKMEVLLTSLMNGDDLLGSHAATVLDSEQSTANDSSQLTTESVISESPNKNVEIAITKSEFDDKGGFLVLHPASNIETGDYILEIDYEVPIDGYAIVETNKSAQRLSDAELKLVDLRKFLPVFNEVSFKARFSFTLLQPASMKIFANMPIERTAWESQDWTFVTYEETPPISPHNLAAFATDNVEALDKRLINETNVTFWAETLKPGDGTYLIDMFETCIHKLIGFFESNYPMRKLDVIGLHNADHNSGYPGLITIQESLYNITDNSPKLMKEHAMINVMKLITEQWLGGLVNMQNSSDAWLLESSTLYLQHWLSSEDNQTVDHSTFIMDVQPAVLEANGYSVSRSLQFKLNPSHLKFYRRDAYAMGACLISMSHGALNTTEFRDGYVSFISRWAGGNADVASLWEAMTRSMSEDGQREIEVNLVEIMKLWTTQSGYPVVTVTRNYETGSAVVRQARFSYDRPSSASTHLWHIPLNWLSNNESGSKWIEPQEETKLDGVSQPGEISWVIFDASKSGLYRINYEEDNWKMLAEALRQNPETFLPAARARLIDDAFSLAFADLLPYSIVFDIIDYLPENDRDPEPWSYLLHHAMKLNLALYGSPVYISYQEFMVKFLSKLYNQVGSQISDGSRLTLIVHQLAALFDYPEYLTWAKTSFDVNSTGLPIKSDVPSYLNKNLLCAFAKLEHELGWQWWQKKFTNVTNREERNSLLSSLACFQVSSMLQAVLNEIVYSKSFVEDDALVILESFSNFPTASETALQFVESNWKNITKRYQKSCKIATAFLDASSTAFNSEADIEDFQIFRDKNYESLKKVGYVTALLEAKANASVTFIQTSLTEFQTSIASRISTGIVDVN